MARNGCTGSIPVPSTFLIIDFDMKRFIFSVFSFLSITVLSLSSISDSYASGSKKAPQFFKQENPVSWNAKAVSKGNNIYEIQLISTVSAGWHVYDLGPYTDGPNATIYRVSPAAGTPKGAFELIGKPFIKGRVTKAYDDVFDMTIGTFESGVAVVQKVKILTDKACKATASIEWQSCNNGNCMSPQQQEFTVSLPAATGEAIGEAKNNTGIAAAANTTDKSASGTAGMNSDGTTGMNSDASSAESYNDETIAEGSSTDGSTISGADADGANAASVSTDNSGVEKRSLWSLVLEAIAWGFVALLTPCVFPMVPMTVSFFLKQSDKGEKKDDAVESENKKKSCAEENKDGAGASESQKKKRILTRGRFMALLYGISIVAVYTLPIAIIILVTFLVGGGTVTADIFNWLATNWIPNLLFFAIFMVFALSFFGAFEITMPSRMVNKADSKSNKGGILGVFFMALTLVLVSFSCTGPIVGTILIKSTQGEVWAPIIAMLAFSIAFAIPFTIFAFVPSLLKDLPKSGGWLNTVKVVLGFLELALGMKFLSVADQTYHWGILDREVYLAFWIVIFSLLGLYMLGKLKFAYDSKRDHLSVPRLILSIIIFAFVVYMIPGMWGAPLKALSGYLPPIETQDFRGQQDAQGITAPNGVNGADNVNINGSVYPKYSDVLHLPHGLKGFFDFDEGLEYAKKVGKPVFLDFTGHGCVNCREMEARVWSNPIVLQILSKEYVIIALYADDKMNVAEEDYVTIPNGKVLKQLGEINSQFVLNRFGANAQPYYIVLDNDGKPLVSPMGYNLDVKVFTKFLQNGAAAFSKKSKQQ